MLDGGAGQARRLETVWRGRLNHTRNLHRRGRGVFCWLVDDGSALSAAR